MREIAALLAALTFALPASAADALAKSKMVNCKVGEVPVWTSGDGYKCAPFPGNLTLYDSKCPDGWHLVFTTQNEPMCAWVLREPGH